MIRDCSLTDVVLCFVGGLGTIGVISLELYMLGLASAPSVIHLFK